MFNVGDEVIAIQEFDFKNNIIGIAGQVVYKDNNYLSVFFYEDIAGHSGYNWSETCNIRKILAKKYNVPEANCWDIPDSIRFLAYTDKREALNFKLKKIAKI